MCFLRIGNPIAVDVAVQLGHDALSNVRARPRVRPSDDWRDWLCGQMVEREYIQTGQVDIDPAEAHFNL